MKTLRIVVLFVSVVIITQLSLAQGAEVPAQSQVEKEFSTLSEQIKSDYKGLIIILNKNVNDLFSKQEVDLATNTR